MHTHIEAPTRTSQTPQPFQGDRLKHHNIAEQFQLKLKSCFEALTNPLQLEEKWLNFRNVTTEYAEGKWVFIQEAVDKRTWKIQYKMNEKKKPTGKKI
ncbi:craniofacial development protein 2 [Biomphalaria glabrata]|nr:craniofacial development protein 2 [Biomphalaria glabrata]